VLGVVVASSQKSLSKGSEESLKLLGFNIVFWRTIDRCECKWANPVFDDDAGGF